MAMASNIQHPSSPDATLPPPPYFIKVKVMTYQRHRIAVAQLLWMMVSSPSGDALFVVSSLRMKMTPTTTTSSTSMRHRSCRRRLSLSAVECDDHSSTYPRCSSISHKYPFFENTPSPRHDPKKDDVRLGSLMRIVGSVVSFESDAVNDATIYFVYILNHYFFIHR